MIVQTNVSVKQARMKLIKSPTKPITSSAGNIWIDTQLLIKNIYFSNSIDPNLEQNLQPNSLYLFASIVDGEPPINYKLFDFGNNLIITRDIAGFIITGDSGTQVLGVSVNVYDLNLNDYINVYELQLPLMFSEYLNLSNFFAAEVSSLFEALGITEEVDIEASIQEILDPLHLGSFFGADTTGLFENLRITEQLTMTSGGNQIYP